MAVTADIAASWLRHRAVTRRLLARGSSEAFAFSFLLAFLVLALAAVSPLLSRQALQSGETSVLPRLYASALGLLATIPLWYLLAALAHLLARALGGTGSYYGARLALFWSLLVTAPAMLLHGLIAGMAGQGAMVNLLGLAVALAFLTFWFRAMIEVEKP
jgi:hypothetical protein